MTSETSTHCQRCGRPARGRAGSSKARMLRRAKTGVCVECGVVQFLQQLDNMHGGNLFPDGTAESLLLPHVREQFAATMKAGMADAMPDEIDWERVIAIWDIAPQTKGTLF